MGIKGISKLIREYGKDISMSDLQNKRIAIDTSIYLYKFKYNTNGYDFIKRFISQICLFKTNNITPIYIFDGKPPVEKMVTLNKRKDIKEKNILNAENEIDVEIKKSIEKNIINITKEDTYNLKKLFDHCNISYVTPDTEGEKYCSYLNKIGEVDVVMSNDFDSLTFGCANLITCSGDFNYKEYSLNDILKGLSISIDDYIELCIACGTDYYPQGIPKIGPVKGLINVKKYGNIEEWKNIIIPDNININIIRNIFKEDPELIDLINVKTDSNYTELKNFLISLDLHINDNTIKKLINCY